ncbi:MAG TPA: methylated-DNA--[protein]-cysteine S-methyltransferase [Gemmatimonadales bacterium]
MLSTDYERIAAAIAYLEKNADRRPDLADVARAIGLSPSHLQRVFTRWAGVSPKRFLQYLTLRDARRRLREGASVLETSYAVGLSGGGRLHDLFVTVDAVTPGEFKSRGHGLTIQVGVHASPFGPALIARSERGLCGLEFVNQPDDAAVHAFCQRWRGATVLRTERATAQLARRVFAGAGRRDPLQVFLRGTNFQLKVWEALLRIPAGEVVSYASVAAAIGRPGSSRAVGNAVSANPIAYLIPCHRVLRESGALGGYRWGVERKRAMLARELGEAAA